MKIITIGVYGFEEDQFFQALQDANVDTFCDIRWRRGVRGSTYAFANSQRLQNRLGLLGIHYLHRKDLAPSPEIREQQYAVDKETKTAKRQRTILAEQFIEAYEHACLTDFEPQSLLDELPEEAKVVAFFCVEREPAACHRSLVADRLVRELGWDVAHILPE
ncbi:MAG: DUF488 domain-containing protein [Chloroflexota bacterium]